MVDAKSNLCALNFSQIIITVINVNLGQSFVDFSYIVERILVIIISSLGLMML